MRDRLNRLLKGLALTGALLLFTPLSALAVHGNNSIEGLTSPTGVFYLDAKTGHISTGDGDSLFFWGYAEHLKTVQYPGPTLIVTEGDTVEIHLTSHLPEATSIVIPGIDVTATGGVPGLITREAPPDRVTEAIYTFTADRPGTFAYYSGTHTDLQVEMGLVGAIIVRPIGFDQATPAGRTAYGDARSAYDHEYLFLLTEMDPRIHNAVELGGPAAADTTDFAPTLWFINGRNAPDTMSPAHATYLPTQPYNIMAMMNIGERMLLRFIGAGRDSHPFHTHANNFDIIARDSWVLESGPGVSIPAEVGTIPDLSESNFTQNVVPGATYDAIFTWTGTALGWDIYGHAPDDAMEPGEDANDHGTPFPVVLPDIGEMTFGAFYSGSPFMGAEGSLPPGEGGNNPMAGFTFMWHSHNEKEMTNNDIFPGGMMTMLIVEPPPEVIAPPAGP